MIDLTNRRFDRWLVIGFSHRIKNVYLWFCRCDCGVVKTVRRYDLISGSSRSCGCIFKELISERNKTHGKSKTSPAYYRWKAMKQRCCNKNSSRYKDYGGRGITVCARWLNSFDAFLSDMGEPPTDKHVIDRIDNNGPYSPENCRWVTYQESSLNTRGNRFITIDGVTKSIIQWANFLGVTPKTIYDRISRGWSLKETLTTLPRQRRR